MTDAELARIASYWWGGLNTMSIARLMRVPECVVYNVLPSAREKFPKKPYRMPLVPKHAAPTPSDGA